MEDFLIKAKNASRLIATLSSGTKTKILNQMSQAILDNIDLIIQENNKDMSNGYNNKLSKSFLDRLLLNEKRIQDMAKAIKQIALQVEPVGKLLDGWQTKDGLNVQKVSIPIGVIGIIYESRPNVTSDAAALCFKSGNACILKGGKEAIFSNAVIGKILQKVLEINNLPKEIISLLPDYSRDGVGKLIKEDKYVDLIIPRGGTSLVSFISKNSSVPVIKHDKGVCHIYIDKEASVSKIINIIINAKCQRPSACNSVETVLIHSNIAPYILDGLKDALEKQGTILKGCKDTINFVNIPLAEEEDFFIEHLSNALNIKIVNSTDEAIDHICKYGSRHSESILSENYTTVNKFLNEVDAACVYANASTRFTDGGELGFGAEVGISTNKLHARGPMGINDLTTYKYKILGQGQIRN